MMKKLNVLLMTLGVLMANSAFAQINPNETTSVPEPGVLALLLAGFGVAYLVNRKTK